MCTALCVCIVCVRGVGLWCVFIVCVYCVCLLCVCTLCVHCVCELYVCIVCVLCVCALCACMVCVFINFRPGLSQCCVLLILTCKVECLISTSVTDSYPQL